MEGGREGEGEEEEEGKGVRLWTETDEDDDGMVRSLPRTKVKEGRKEKPRLAGWRRRRKGGLTVWRCMCIPTRPVGRWKGGGGTAEHVCSEEKKFEFIHQMQRPKNFPCFELIGLIYLPLLWVVNW